MKEEKKLKELLIKHMKVSIITFSIILTLFGVFIFLIISKSTYNSLDSELKQASKIFEFSEFKDYNLYMNEKDFKQYNDFYKIMSSITDSLLSQKIINPKIICIIRDNNLEVVNGNDLGKIYNTYFESIEFDKGNLEKVYSLKIQDKYNYRAINIKLDSLNKQQVRYIQLLTSSDSETNLLKNYFIIILYSVLFGILLSIIASYILSKSTLKPIQEVIEKQTEFVANVSHELRTPLTIIQAKQELLLKEPNSKIIDKTEEIVLSLEETKRLGKMTKDLMLLARADSKQMELDKEEVNIDEFITNFLTPYEDIIKAQNKEIKLDLKYEKYIDIDKSKIYQVLVILLDNAIKYTEENDIITIRTYLKENKFCIEVQDTGIGISKEGLKYVFDRFYREDKARNRKTGGSGLGLSIAHTIITAHKGSITVSNNNPKGTIFTIKIPR